MTAINMATLPAYYYLYALYFDYLINNRFHAGLEHEAKIRDALRRIQPLMRRTQPYRKTWALRLFTERSSLERFPPQLVDEAWRQLHELVRRVGPPADWRQGPLPREHGRSAERPLPSPQEAEATRPYEPPFPKPPIVYDFTV
jgi:hypothetical protein